jgi:hypothetical protein
MGKIVSTLVIIVAGAVQMIAADAEVNGVFKGNDQPAKLAFVSAHKGTPLRGQETIKLIFSEKDHSKDKEADLKTFFGDYGSVLVIGIQLDGKVVTCDARHEAHKQKPISSPSSVKMSEFKNENGQLSGKLTTDGTAEAFGET